MVEELMMCLKTAGLLQAYESPGASISRGKMTSDDEIMIIGLGGEGSEDGSDESRR